MARSGRIRVLYASVVFLVLLTATVFSLHGNVRGEKKGTMTSTCLNPFLNLLDTSFKYLILPVPVVFLRFAF